MAGQRPDPEVRMAAAAAAAAPGRCGTSRSRSGNLLLLLLIHVPGIAATNMEPIYWNSLNKRFGDSRGYILYPQIGDRLDLICPGSDHPSPQAPAEYEYYKLYLVSSREQADRCEVTGTPNLLLTCDKPTSDMRFTIKFQEFSPNLWGHEFKTMHDYYIIATSDGTRQGLESMRGGVCVTRGMKVVLKVGQNPYGLPPKSARPDSGQTNSKTPSITGISRNSTLPGGLAEGENGPLPPSNLALIAGAAGGSAFLLLVSAVVCVVCYRHHRSKPSDSRHPPLSLSSLTSPKRSSGGAGNNNGSEPSDIIIPLRPSDSAFCPHYEKVSGDYGHPVYIVQEMPPQNPANIYYKV
ncbi:ephrin-B3-like isoform X1 [Scleropages formosus]|uniref:Ephrin-B3 n=2 Tax=Scleropages formosus TaxID=113540 RepID=A0A8D0CEV1_SCLFO|nr:ephrin-B3-like isoform X1 [Scleropages formosus]